MGTRGFLGFVIDGQNISSFTTGFRLTASVHEATQLEVDLMPTKGATVVADAAVSVSAEVHEFLVRLGWTPPTSARKPPS